MDENGKFVPNPKVTSFNAHRLHLPTWREPIRSRRALVFADAIGESNPVPGYKTKKQQYLMEGESGLILGALYQEWEGKDGPIYSVAIITTEAHPHFAQYHEKSTPLFLPADETMLRDWLSKDVIDPPMMIDGMMPPRLPVDLRVSEVKTYKRAEIVARPWTLPADE